MDRLFNNSDLYPTPVQVIEIMMQDQLLKEKVILEPSAGTGNIIDYLQRHGATVTACEINTDLRKIIETKCSILADDFLKVESHQISHIDMIVMNPPFSADSQHIEHAFNIAPAGCTIIALCNLQTLKNTYSEQRRRLLATIEAHGHFEELGQCFAQSERVTGVEVALIRMTKPGAANNTEFEGFFMDEEPQESGAPGLMPYNAIRDLVQRYTGAVRIFDEQLNAAVKMNQLTSGFFSSGMGMSVTNDNKPVQRGEFKKAMQKSGWQFIFNKLNMQKYSTKGLKEDLNNFIEKQTHIPFTMRNIYKMLEIIVGTQSGRMDKAILEVFDRVTRHYDDNKFNVEGWKTNSHFLLNEKFILPYMVDTYSWSWNANYIATSSSGNYELVEDMQKAICYLTGANYDELQTLYSFLRDNKTEYGKWVTWNYFEVRGYKKGTMHFKFKSQDLWAKFNQKVAQLKGYPLYEHNKQQAAKTEAKQRREAPARPAGPKVEPVVLGTFQLKVAI